MDLANRRPKSASDEGRWLHVIDPELKRWDGKFRILLAGEESKIFRDARREFQDKRSIKANQGVQTPQKVVDKYLVEILARCTLAWEGLTDNGIQVACDFKHVLQTYQECDWLRKQVDLFIGDVANYLGAGEEREDDEDETLTTSTQLDSLPHYQAEVEENLSRGAAGDSA